MNNDGGKVSVLEGIGLFMYDIKCKLLSPKDRFVDLQRLRKPEGSFIVTWDKRIYSTAESLATTGCVTSEKNQNPNHLEKLLLQLHFKLGHTGYSTVQWIGRQGWMGKLG